MKRILTLAILLVILTSAYAQVKHRGRPENTTDYSHPALTPGMKRIGTLASAPLKCMGTKHVPVVLVQFADKRFDISGSTDAEVHDVYDKFFNGTRIPGQRYTDSQNYGSVSDYFIAQSDSQFIPDFEVIGPITLTESYAYYGSNSPYKDANIQKFYNEACQKAVTNFDVDWNYFDNDHNGTIDFVFFIYAGEGENAYYDNLPEHLNLIWPKEQTSPMSVDINGARLTFGGYGCTNEEYEGIQDGIGTCIHELSHAIGLPDFYDTNYIAFGLDAWDVMDYGNYLPSGYATHPCGYSAYEKDFMGWRKMQTISHDEHLSLTLQPMENHDGIAYKIENPANPNEYFILENRQNIDWDGKLVYFYRKYGPGHGLLISHVDYTSSAWTGNRVNSDRNHQRFTIVPADGKLMPRDNKRLEEYAQSLIRDAYPGPNSVIEMTSYAVFTGGTIPMTVTNIQEHADGTITLDLNGGSPKILPGDANEDGNVDVMDVVAIADHILNNTAINEKNADANNDGKIDVLDIVAISGIILGN